MKIDAIKDELSGLSVPEVEGKIAEYRHALLSLRLKALTSHVKDVAEFRKLRKNIARGLTYKHQKEAQANKNA
jgi:ribosomal protein L29